MTTEDIKHVVLTHVQVITCTGCGLTLVVQPLHGCWCRCGEYYWDGKDRDGKDTWRWQCRLMRGWETSYARYDR